MTIRLKPLDQQVVVITGASSGIGLATARMAAAKGARLVLVARNDVALKEVVDEIRDQGGQAIHVAVDVASEGDVRRIADEAVAAFGGFDTWVNNAGVSVYGRTHEALIDDLRRTFETNFWGVVYGSRVASQHLRERGGAIINIGSELSDVPAPLQGMYSASKHAVKGWTDAMRMELQDEGAPISVTLIKPAAIDTPYADHAGNEMDDHPQHVPPVFARRCGRGHPACGHHPHPRPLRGQRRDGRLHVEQDHAWRDGPLHPARSRPRHARRRPEAHPRCPLSAGRRRAGARPLSRAGASQPLYQSEGELVGHRFGERGCRSGGHGALALAPGLNVTHRGEAEAR